MKRWRQTIATLVAVAAAGALVWFVPHFHRWTTGGYWAMVGLLIVAGLLIGLSQLRGQAASRASFLTAFLPVLVAAGWVLLVSQPRTGWIRDHVLTWSRSLEIDHAVHNLGEHVAVLAFGLGVVLGSVFEPTLLRRRPRIDTAVAAPPAAGHPLAEEPATPTPGGEEVENDERTLVAPRV
jgi:hypothetical protein